MAITGNSARRIAGLDALRGIAAMSVVLFHYTTRFGQTFGHPSAPTLSFDSGFRGVDLFFMISGFVIFMTLERTARPLDFVVSRFSRLFPTYWVAIAVTFAITHWLGLPGKLVGAGDAVANLMMVHGLFRIPHVDGVYWTLEVELLFYIGMFTLYRAGRLHDIHRALWLMLGFRLLYFVMAAAFGIDLPWTLFRLAILKYIPWFALGISVHTLLHPRAGVTRQASLTTMAVAVATLAIAESLFLGTLSAVLAALVYAAASGRAGWLRNPVLVFLGAISYPLYLLHENIGWSVQLQALSWGLPIDATILLALAVSLALSTALHALVEQPAMDWIRRRYREKTRVEKAA